MPDGDVIYYHMGKHFATPYKACNCSGLKTVGNKRRNDHWWQMGGYSACELSR